MKQSTYNHQDSDKLSNLYYNMYSPEELLTTGEAPGMLPEGMGGNAHGGSVDVAGGSAQTEIAGPRGPVKREAAGSAKAAVDSANARKKHKMDKKDKKKPVNKGPVIDPESGTEVGSKEWVKHRELMDLDANARHGQSDPY